MDIGVRHLQLAAGTRVAGAKAAGVLAPALLFAPGAPLFAQEGGSFWLPPARSTIAPEVDNLFFLVLGGLVTTYLALNLVSAKFGTTGILNGFNLTMSHVTDEDKKHIFGE